MDKFFTDKAILYVGLNNAKVTYFKTYTNIKDVKIIYHDVNLYYIYFNREVYSPFKQYKFIKKLILDTYNKDMDIKIKYISEEGE